MKAHELIMQADALASSKGLTQQQWSREAGFDENGMCVSRTVSRGNCKLSTIVELLKPLGAELMIVEVRNGKE